MTQVKQVRRSLVRDQLGGAGQHPGKGQQVRQPDEPKGGAAKRDGQQAAMSPDDGVR